MNYFKPYLYVFLYVIISIVLIGIGRELENGAFKILWQIVSFFLILKYRHPISAWLMKFRWSTVLVFTASSLPFMLVEENINCAQTGCVLVPITIPFLILYLLIIYFVVHKLNARRFWVILTFFCFLGVLWEATLGGAHAEFQALPPLWIAIAIVWVWMSYAYLTIVPLTYLLEKRKNLSR